MFSAENCLYCSKIYAQLLSVVLFSPGRPDHLNSPALPVPPPVSHDSLCLSVPFFSSFLPFVRTRSACLPQFVLCARVGGAWRKGKVKGQCSVTVEEQKSVFEVPGSLSLRHNCFLWYRFVTQFQQLVWKRMAQIWLRKIAYRYCWLVLFFPPPCRGSRAHWGRVLHLSN
jgi:hypothetical protein